jgi:hypothetical protein
VRFTSLWLEEKRALLATRAARGLAMSAGMSQAKRGPYVLSKLLIRNMNFNLIAAAWLQLFAVQYMKWVISLVGFPSAHHGAPAHGSAVNARATDWQGSSTGNHAAFKPVFSACVC